MMRLRTLRLPLRSTLSLGATFGTRGVAAIGGVGLSYWLARAGGAEALGQFTYIQSIVMILALLARAGADQSLIRLVAILNEQGRGGSASRYFFAGTGMGLVLATAVAALAVPLAAGLGLLEGDEIALLGILIWALPPMVVLNVTSGYLRGQRMVAMGMLIDVGTVSGIAALLAWLMNATSVSRLAWLFVATTGVMMMIMLVWAIFYARRRYRSAWLDSLPADMPRIRSYLLGGWPFSIIAIAIYGTQPGSFALGGPVLDDHALGLLRAAERFAILIGFAFTAISPFIAPRVAASCAARGISGVRNVYRRAIVVSTVAATPAAIVVVIFGERLLVLFGPQFATAYPLLLIMGGAQYIQACLGSSSVVLSMAGKEREPMLVSVAMLIAACILFPALSQWLGSYGFASAYILIVVTKELVLLNRVRHLLAEKPDAQLISS